MMYKETTIVVVVVVVRNESLLMLLGYWSVRVSSFLLFVCFSI